MNSEITTITNKAYLALATAYGKDGLDESTLHQISEIYQKITKHCELEYPKPDQKKNLEEFSKRLLHSNEEKQNTLCLTSYKLNPEGILDFIETYSQINHVPDLHSATKPAFEKITPLKKTSFLIQKMQLDTSTGKNLDLFMPFIFNILNFVANPDYKNSSESPSVKTLNKLKDEKGLSFVIEGFASIVNKNSKKVKELTTLALNTCSFAFIEFKNHVLLAHLNNHKHLNDLFKYLDQRIANHDKVISFKVGEGTGPNLSTKLILHGALQVLNRYSANEESNIHSPANQQTDSVSFSTKQIPNEVTYFNPIGKFPKNLTHAILDKTINNCFNDSGLIIEEE